LGERHAGVRAPRASYEAAVASYRNTVLTAFEDVENDLSGLRILAQQTQALETAVKDARRGTDIALAEFKAGTADYTTVAQAQEAQLGDEQSLLSAQQTRLTDAVSLIADLGGGWSAADLHSPSDPKSLPPDPSESPPPPPPKIP
jgi:outer membrane protein TolC